jgi:hypothetical protein
MVDLAKIKSYAFDEVAIFGIVVAETWCGEGAYQPCGKKLEAYCIQYFPKTGMGQIVEAECRGRDSETNEKIPYDNTLFVKIPEAIVATVKMNLFDLDAEKNIDKLDDWEKRMSILGVNSWKPLDWSYLKFIRENCYCP